jgi:hypothetical protein
MVDSLTPKQLSAIQRAVRNPELQPLLFRKAKGLVWFDSFNNQGFFNSEKNPRPIPAKEEGSISIPFWPVTEYLVNVSSELSNSENEDYATKFIHLIRDITLYAKKENYSNFRTWWQFSQIIRKIPIRLILPEDIDIIDYWLDDPFERGIIAEEIGEKWLPELLEKFDEHSRQITLLLLDSLYKIRFVDKKVGSYERKEPSLRYDSYYAERITDKIAKLSGAKLGLPAVEIFENRIILILNEGNNDSWSSIWRNAIEKHEQNVSRKDADNIILAAYRDCLLGFVDNNALAANSYIKILFNSKYQTLQRIAIYALDVHYHELKDLAYLVIDPKYFHDNFRHELWHFLNNHYRELNPDQQSKILEIIEGLNVTDEANNIKDKETVYHRSRWLKSIKEFDERSEKLYQDYTKVTGTEPEHPDFSSYMTVGWVDHKSPIPLEHFLSLTIDEIVYTINNYKDTGRGRFDEPGLEGLIKTFKDVLKARAKDIYLDLLKFSNSDLPFIYTLIEAYRELWAEKKELPWNDIWPLMLNFCLEIINKKNFWSEDNAKESSNFVANRHWIVGAIGRLIEEGTKSDDHAFEKSLLLTAKEILLVLLKRQEGEEFKYTSDAVSVSINSPRGRCIEGLINLTLRSCRLEHNEHNKHLQSWSQYKDIYDDELKRSEKGEFEFITLVSMYLPNFNYMSIDWVQFHLAEIFNQSDYQKWLCAMQGYVHVNNIYEIFYKYLKENGDFLKALDDANLKKHVVEKIIQNIVIAFIYDFEDVNKPNSLIDSLLQRRNVDELKQLIWFFWTLRDKNNKKLKDKVYQLWPLILDITDVTTKEGRKLASTLCQWASFVDNIDPVVESWLLKIAPYAEESYNAPRFLESLAEISDAQPIEAQKVWIKMLESYSYDYPEEAFRRIFRNLLARGDGGERKAKEIVSAYIRHGIDRPRMWLIEEMTTSTKAQ